MKIQLYITWINYILKSIPIEKLILNWNNILLFMICLGEQKRHLLNNLTDSTFECCCAYESKERETLFIFSFFFYQVTDYAIARRIVDLHTRNVESVERVYSTEEIQRYILFARQFQPKARCYSFFTRILFFCCISPCLFVIFWGLLDIQNKVIQVWNDTDVD